MKVGRCGILGTKRLLGQKIMFANGQCVLFQRTCFHMIIWELARLEGMGVP